MANPIFNPKAELDIHLTITPQIAYAHTQTIIQKGLRRMKLRRGPRRRAQEAARRGQA
jgi:hypothetical protein